MQGIDYPVTAFGYHYDLTSLPADFDPVAFAAKPRANRLFMALWY
jgi:hypothetical protein